MSSDFDKQKSGLTASYNLVMARPKKFHKNSPLIWPAFHFHLSSSCNENDSETYKAQ
jgi:hypothetical protein